MFEPYNLVTPPETNLPESQLPTLQYSLPKLQYDLPSLNFSETLFEDSVSLAWGKCYWNFNYKRRDFISLSKFKVREIIQ